MPFLNKKLNEVCEPNAHQKENTTTTSLLTQEITYARLTIDDPLTKMKFLIDTGADLSVLPKRYAENDTPLSRILYAANGTKIATYGDKRLNLSLGFNRLFPWTFTIAEVDCPIIGADFLLHFNLMVDLHGKRLVDGTTLQTMTGSISQSITPSIKVIHEPYQSILNQYQNITELNSSKLIDTPTEHHIITVGPPIHTKARRLAPDKLEAAKKEFDLLTELGICRPSASEWASPLHMVHKADGSWRPCGDYRLLNNVTTPDRYPLPYLQDITAILHNKKFFSKIDLQRAFHQIPLTAEDIPKTAITTPFGLFEFTRLTFGLKNAAQTMQRLINRILAGLDFVFAYIDDILIASRNELEHQRHLKIVLQRLSEHNLAINLDKCLFGKNSLTFLGHQITPDGFSPLAEKVDAITRIPIPCIAKDLKSFLATINFYRRFLPMAAEYQQTLSKLIPGNKRNDKTPIEWTEEGKTAFEKCKTQLASTAMLSYPNEKYELILHTDASDTCVGAALNQLDGALKPLGFYSKRLTDAQRKYSTYDRELTAIFQSIKHFQYLLEGRNFKIYTDHKPLIYAFKQKSSTASPRQTRQLDFISQFSTDIRHVIGKENIVADLLSRIEAINSQPIIITPEEIAEAQQKDPELENILNTPSSAEDYKNMPIFGTDKTIWCHDSTNTPRPFIPSQFRPNIIQQLHGLAHPGRKNTIKFVASRYYWPRMKKDIEKFVKNCLICQQNKTHRHNKSPFQAYAPPNSRFEHINIDIVGPFPITDNMKYCLTIIDRFSKWPEAVAISDMTAPTVAIALTKHWFANFGIPLRITSDQGRQFESDLFHELKHTLGINHLTTTGYHPQSNGIIERFHRTVKASLMSRGAEKWPQKLPMILLALRSTYKEDLQATPAEAVFGQCLRVPGEFFTASTDQPKSTFVKELKKIMEDIRPATTNWNTTERPFINKHLQNSTHVFVKDDKIKKALSPPYEGPFLVLERFDKYYIILIRGKQVKISVDRLKPAFFEQSDSAEAST